MFDECITAGRKCQFVHHIAEWVMDDHNCLRRQVCCDGIEQK